MQQLAFLIPVLVVIWVMIIGIRFANYMEKKYGMNNPMPVPEKRCPAASAETPGIPILSIKSTGCNFKSFARARRNTL